jgi:NADH-quinone oxidoreductase subunit N
MAEYLILLKSEWLVSLIIFLLLFIRIGTGMRNELILAITQFLLLVTVIAGFLNNKEGELFGNMLRFSLRTAIQKNILTAGTYVIILGCSDWLKRSAHLVEFLILMLSALLGMFLMISSGNFLIFFLSLELSTIPVAAMANFDLEKKISSEAAMKMILSSAFSSGIMLFGISLLYGAAGTLSFSELPLKLSINPLTSLSFIFLFTAFAFKLSIVPFHLWTADVYEGAPIAATAFLSVMSKGSVAFVLVNVLYHAFKPMESLWYPMLVILAIATMLVGNLFAIRQNNIKRFLAFSSIAQVGFILVGMSAASYAGQTSVIYFILVYLFSNLAAFIVVGVISSRTGKETITDYRGLYRTNPRLAWIMALALFSLAGIPPTAGFFGKLFLITSGASAGHFWFILVAALNMIISLYYYLAIVRSMFMDKNDKPLEKIRAAQGENFALLICTIGILLTGLFSWIYEYLNELK